MLNKGTKAYSILKMKCPRCHTGDIFFHSNPYALLHLGKTHENCPYCQLKFDMEPGFFLGAMYVSYAMAGALALSSGLVLTLLFPTLDIIELVGLVLVEITLLMPILFRLSRAIWLNVFVSYKKESTLNKPQ